MCCDPPSSTTTKWPVFCSCVFQVSNPRLWWFRARDWKLRFPQKVGSIPFLRNDIRVSAAVAMEITWFGFILCWVHILVCPAALVPGKVVSKWLLRRKKKKTLNSSKCDGRGSSMGARSRMLVKWVGPWLGCNWALIAFQGGRPYQTQGPWSHSKCFNVWEKCSIPSYVFIVF